MVRFFLFVLLVATVDSTHQEPKKHGFEETFYSLVDAKDEASFRDILKDYSRSIRNESVDPCDNFYEYACGNWAKVSKTDDVKDYNVAKSVFFGTNYVLYKLLSENITSQDEPPVVIAKKFFKICTNNETWNANDLFSFVESFGPFPLTTDSWTSNEFDWFNAVAKAHAHDVQVLFKQSFGDSKIPWKGNIFYPLEKNIINKFLENRNISDSEEFVHEIKKIFKENGVDLEGKEMMIAEVYDFETKLKLIPTRIDEDPNFNFFEISETNEIFGDNFLFKYLKVLRGKRVRAQYTLLIKNALTLTEVFNFITETDDHIIANDIYINFVLTFLLVMEAMKQDSGGMCTTLVKTKYKEAAVLMLTEKFYDNKTEEEMNGLVRRIIDASQAVIGDTEWITNETRLHAQMKLVAVDQLIAFNKAIYNFETQRPIYNAIEIEEGHFFINLLKACRHRILQDQNTAPGSIWLHEPLTVNAAFASGLSLMSIPFGIIQPPFFHKFSPAFSNYGSLGTIVGHELMHGFDDDGIKFDFTGEISDWFDPRLMSDYFTKVGCYFYQYDKHRLPGLNSTVDGEFTFAENIADNQGFAIAIKTYKNWMESHSELNDTNMDDLQAFFVSYAQTWCYSSPADVKMDRLTRDVHAPSEIRVLKVLSNSQDFAEAFKCPLGSKMNPERKCRYLRK